MRGLIPAIVAIVAVVIVVILLLLGVFGPGPVLFGGGGLAEHTA